MTITASIAAGQRVGLLGGSFNPAHQGHIEITEAARRQLRLDQCWWLVSPGNPLKDPSIYGALDDRCALASAMAQGRPWLRVTAIEDRLGTRYTIDTLKALTTRFASTRFVWLMGADNLASFHQWRDWRGIAAAMPICVVSRPGYAQAALASPAARVLAQYRRREEEAVNLASLTPPAWIYLSAVHNPISSTALRAAEDPFSKS